MFIHSNMGMMAEIYGAKVFTFDKGHSASSIFRETAITEQLKQKYGVRFLPKQVIRRAMRDGMSHFRI